MLILLMVLIQRYQKEQRTLYTISRPHHILIDLFQQVSDSFDCQYTIIAKDWEFTSDLLDSWKIFGFVLVSPTVGKINKSNLEPFLQDLSEKGIDDTEFQAFSVIIRRRRRKPKESSVTLG